MKDTRTAAEIAAQLHDPGTTRTEALAIVTLVKGERLAQLARLLHVVARGVKVADVRDNIVAATVGSRLTTDAILSSRTDRPIPAADPAAAAAAVIRSHATLAARIRHTTEALLAGEVTDPAVLADLAAAAQALADAAADRLAPAHTATITARTDSRNPYLVGDIRVHGRGGSMPLLHPLTDTDSPASVLARHGWVVAGEWADGSVPVRKA